MAYLTTDIEVKDIKPTGYHVLVELLNLYDKNEQGDRTFGDTGIIMAAEIAEKEESVITLAKVLEFGPAAFKKLSNGVNSPEEWGVKVGDIVSLPTPGESASTNPRDKRRIILDQDIKAVVTTERK